MPSFLTIPFTGPLGVSSGPNNDGVQIGTAPQVPSPICLNGFHSLGAQHVATYDAISGTSVSVVDESATIAAYLAGTSSTTWAFGDTVSGHTMSLLFDLSAALTYGAVGVSLQVVTAGAYTGTITASNILAQTWNSTTGAWQSATVTAVSGNLNAIGAFTITFNQIPPVGVSSGQAGYPAPVPMGSAGIRNWLWIQFQGITAWTTDTQIGGAWVINGSAGSAGWQNLTSVTNQTGNSPSFAAQPAITFPQVGDLFLYGDANKFCRINTRLFRSAATTYTKQWVYWSITSNSWAPFPTGTLTDGGATNTIAVSGSETDFVVGFVPPSDWGSQTLTDTNGVAHPGYYVGLQVTAVNSPFTPPPPAELLFSVTEITGSNVMGMPLANGANFNYIVMGAQQAATAISNFVVANVTTGSTFSVSIPAGTAAYAAPISFAAAAGNTFVVVQISGAPTPANNLEYGWFTLQGP
jgi:hypothetical protein